MSPTRPDLSNPISASPVFAWIASHGTALDDTEPSQIKQIVRQARSWLEYDADALAHAEEVSTTVFNQILNDNAQDRSRLIRIVKELEAYLERTGHAI